ncbi:hypothetical protein LOTGIDRAFT_174565 [Lottia gigantea]|uniref:Uncharacterized protein n=1 Tax=Lottia gigantea TaxID=225164 RepID=V4AQS4_LOTGI|nr:hypothetical protein LOTGIDRAFT_174565 [Lottia gigantea]ESO97180.1 hypothetical protein LOTGIDRAFT_174565 [Lottia gigantea]
MRVYSLPKDITYPEDIFDVENDFLPINLIFPSRSREDKNITVEELEKFNEILDKFDVEISSIKVKNSYRYLKKKMDKIGNLNKPLSKTLFSRIFEAIPNLFSRKFDEEDEEKFKYVVDRTTDIFKNWENEIKISTTNMLFSELIKRIAILFNDFKIKGQIEINGQIYEKGEYKQDMRFSGFNAQTFKINHSKMHDKSDASDWYFTGEIIFCKNNFSIVKRSKTGRGGNLLKKINEYKGENCYIPSDGYCFIKCVNHFMNKDLIKEFQDFVNSFQKA